MKLLLTSNGLSSKKLEKVFIGLLEKKVEENKILVIHTAQKTEHLLFVDSVGKEISRTGILLPNITYLNISQDIPKTNLSKYNIVYVCGGNTFFILDRIKKTGLEKFIKSFVKNGGIYVGVSAGSIIVGPDISIAGEGSDGDSNYLNLKNLQGLNLTKFATFPHYKTKLRKEVSEFKGKVNYPIEILKDGEALQIFGGKNKKIVN